MQSLKDFFENEKKRTILFLVISGISLVVSFFDIGSLPFNAAWIAIIICGIPIIKGAVIGLVTKFDIKADVLVALALISAVIIDEIFAAGEVAFIMALGSALEELTVAKARAGIEKLINLSPRTARVVMNDGSERVVPAQDVQINDLLRVLPGESVAVDGVITYGQTSIDQSVMTGESLPVDKSVGDEVFSGTVNQFGAFDMKALKVGENSSLQRMIRLVESADAGKAKIVSLADKWATWIVLIALVSAAGTWFITGEVIRAVTILVVFCPCALVLATPTAIMAGIGNAAKFGMLIKEGDALERLAKVKIVVFDKTGTLTYGKPEIVAVESFDSSIHPDELLRIAAAAEMRSEHPLGKAITAGYFKKTGETVSIVEDFIMITGRGVKVLVDGKAVLAGNSEMMSESGITISENIENAVRSYRQQVSTVVFIAVSGKLTGFIALADSLRADSRATVKKLEKQGLETVLLTGDHHEAAKHIAESAGITKYHYECRPEDKMFYVDKYRKQGKLSCMIGDGINDAPALKSSFVGIAMGGIGSDIAVEAADIALVGDEIRHIPHLVNLAKKTMSTINFNIIMAMLLNFAGIFLAMGGYLTPVLGALVHNVGSVLVIINSALLLKYKNV